MDTWERNLLGRGNSEVKALRWEGVTKFEEEQEDQRGWGVPPSYAPVGDEIIQDI